MKTHLMLVCLAAIALVIASPALADVCTFVGATNADWNEILSWECCPVNDPNCNIPLHFVPIVGDEATCTAAVIARVLASREGGRKDAGERHYVVVVNKADRDETRALALAATILEAGVPRVVVAALRDEEAPVRAVLTAEDA